MPVVSTKDCYDYSVDTQHETEVLVQQIQVASYWANVGSGHGSRICRIREAFRRHKSDTFILGYLISHSAAICPGVRCNIRASCLAITGGQVSGTTCDCLRCHSGFGQRFPGTNSTLPDAISKGTRDNLWLGS